MVLWQQQLKPPRHCREDELVIIIIIIIIIITIINKQINVAFSTKLQGHVTYIGHCCRNQEVTVIAFLWYPLIFIA